MLSSSSSVFWMVSARSVRDIGIPSVPRFAFRNAKYYRWVFQVQYVVRGYSVGQPLLSLCELHLYVSLQTLLCQRR